MVPFSVSVSLGITAVFLVLGTKTRYIYSVVLQIVSLIENEVWIIPNPLGISEKRSNTLVDKEKELEANIEGESYNIHLVSIS